MGEIFPPREAVEERVHLLCWSQHGGSGYGFSRRDILEMNLDEMDRYIKRANGARARMARAMESARKKAAARPRRTARPRGWS